MVNNMPEGLAEQVEEVLEEPGRIELKYQFVELRAKGWSYARIARKLKVSKSTLSNWRAELEADIASLRAMELDALYERYYMLKEGRIKQLGGQVKAIIKELKSRDLSEVSTEKLLELLLKFYDVLQAEYVELRPLSDGQIAELKAVRR